MFSIVLTIVCCVIGLCCLVTTVIFTYDYVSQWLTDRRIQADRKRLAESLEGDEAERKRYRTPTQ